MQTNGGNWYQHDPEYGGKVSLSGFQNARATSPTGHEHLPPMPPDHPRVRELIGSEAATRWEAQLISRWDAWRMRLSLDSAKGAECCRWQHDLSCMH